MEKLEKKVVIEKGKKRAKIAVINPFPGSMSAEHEVILRMQRAAEEIGIDLVSCDTFGRKLDPETQELTKEKVDEKELLFAITTHYLSHKALDTFYYHTLWNPPEIPLNVAEYDGYITDNYVMNDDYLTYDFGGMKNHLKSILMRKPRDLEDCSTMTTSFPASAVMEPRLDSPMMFYCGMNWEKVVHNSNRHEGLFKLLDKTGKVKFFGPDYVKEWGGLRPWKGYKCYQYSIPFDGFSIIEEINKCGVCLVLSSDAHRRAAAATTRLYEACAAGAVIISDENEFVTHNFRDAALFIQYNKDNPQDTYQQIMEKYKWIIEHPKDALEMARRAQKIFLEKLTLNIQLEQIIANHPKRLAQIAKDLYATGTQGKVLTTYVLDTLDAEIAKTRLKSVIANIKNQAYPDIELAIAADKSISAEIDDYCVLNCVNVKVHGMQLFDSRKCRIMTDGQAIRKLQKATDYRFYINTKENETWFSDHITTLVRTMEDEDSVCASSGVLADYDGLRRSFCFEKVNASHIYSRIWNSESFPASGQFLFSAECDQFLPDYLFDNIDGKEHYAYTGIVKYIHKKEIPFSNRMTLCVCPTEKPLSGKVLDDARQSRFIRDLIRHYLPEGNASIVSGAGIAKSLATFPIGLWTKTRFWKALMHRAWKNGRFHEKCREKYINMATALEDRMQGRS